MGWVYSTSEVGLYKAPDNSGQPVRRCPSICIHLCTFCSNICVLPRFKLAWPWSESPRSFKRDQGAHPRGASRGLCSLLGGVSSGSKSNFSSSSDPRGINSNKATSLAEEAAQTSCLLGGQARAWSDPAALVVVAQTEPSTQARGAASTQAAGPSSTFSSCCGLLGCISGWSLDWAAVVTRDTFPRSHKRERENATVTSQLRVTAVPTDIPLGRLRSTRGRM